MQAVRSGSAAGPGNWHIQLHCAHLLGEPGFHISKTVKIRQRPDELEKESLPSSVEASKIKFI